MVVVAQLVRASVCGTEGRRFETDLPPIVKERDSRNWIPFFVSNNILVSNSILLTPKMIFTSPYCFAIRHNSKAFSLAK